MSKLSILFDLDGTLTDPREGIVRCIKHALDGLGIAHPPEAELNDCIGPPIQKSLAKFLGPEREDQRERALELFRERFKTVGMFENEIYPSIPEVLAELQALGHALLVATSKPQTFAKTILEHFRMDRFFSRIYGSELDGVRTDKRELIAYLIEAERIDPTQAVMIGDREFDVIGARANRMQSIGVTWGYGSLEELKSAGADRIVSNPQELLAALLQLEQSAKNSSEC